MYIYMYVHRTIMCMCIRMYVCTGLLVGSTKVQRNKMQVYQFLGKVHVHVGMIACNRKIHACNLYCVSFCFVLFISQLHARPLTSALHHSCEKITMAKKTWCR